MDVEAAFGISVSDAEARALRSAGDLHALVVATSPGAARDPAAAWARLVDIFEREFGVARERVTPGAWVVRDLGIN
jgi:hypothetical protein